MPTSVTLQPRPAPAATFSHTAAWTWAGALPLAVAVCVGVAIRAFYVFGSDFPLNDGALFYQMVVDLKDAAYRRPVVTCYNDAGIPYAYSPFALYVAAVLSDLLRMPLIDVLRYLPFVVSCFTMAAFYSFARCFLGSLPALAAAVLAFAAMPRSFAWMLMGGGLTRSFGFLFVTLALHNFYRFYNARARRHAVWATVFSALTAVSHLGTMPFLVFSALLMLLFVGRHRTAVLGTVAIGLGTVVLTSPWWVAVVAIHGWTPFQAAGGSGGAVWSDPEKLRGLISILAHMGIGSWGWSSTGESLFPIVAVLAMFGTLSSIMRGTWFLPVWWMAILILDTRAGITYASIPVSLLAATGAERLLFPLLSGAVAKDRPPARWRFGRRALLILIVLVGYVAGSSMLKNYTQASDIRFLNSLAAEERQAMQWVADHTPRDSRFLVVPGSQWDGWEVDKSSEWFPLLAKRVSVATVQGSEWLPGQQFARLQKQAKALRACGTKVVACLDDWARDSHQAYTHLYIPQPPLPSEQAYLLCCQLLIPSLQADPRFVLIYQGPGALVFAKRA